MKKQSVTNKIIMLTSIFILVISISFLIGRKPVHANQGIEYNKEFISIEIQNGDTLTSIAKTYSLQPNQIDAYIAEVKDINNLSNDNIHAGCYLLIPIYEIAQ